MTNEEKLAKAEGLEFHATRLDCALMAPSMKSEEMRKEAAQLREEVKADEEATDA